MCNYNCIILNQSFSILMNFYREFVYDISFAKFLLKNLLSMLWSEPSWISSEELFELVKSWVNGELWWPVILKVLKRLWEQWTQHTVRGAFRPLQIFIGQDSWPKGTPDSILKVILVLLLKKCSWTTCCLLLTRCSLLLQCMTATFFSSF